MNAHPTIRPRVVLADDYEPLLRAMDRLLASDCELVGHARSVSELLETTRRSDPDVVVLDVCLPDTNGLDACRRLRALQPDVRVVVVTAMDDASVSAAALDAGASEFVPKRLVVQRLLTAIHSARSQRL